MVKDSLDLHNTTVDLSFAISHVLFNNPCPVCTMFYSEDDRYLQPGPLPPILYGDEGVFVCYALRAVGVCHHSHTHLFELQ